MQARQPLHLFPHVRVRMGVRLRMHISVCMGREGGRREGGREGGEGGSGQRCAGAELTCRAFCSTSCLSNATLQPTKNFLSRAIDPCVPTINLNKWELARENKQLPQL
jgi:hypothetical protein